MKARTRKISREHIRRITRKAKQSICKMRVAALGFNSAGDCVISSTNRPYKSQKGGGIHAEDTIFAQSKQKGVVRILICRIGNGGDLLPIDPCERCAAKAEKLGIRIDTVPLRGDEEK